MNYQIIIVIVSSIVLIILSWRSVRHLYYHGFYRFFAWELIIIQFALTLPVWFKDPFSRYQLISWFLLLLSPFVLYWGVSLLHQLGGERIKRIEIPNYEFENTSTLVTSGIYAFIRHPMYCSLLLLSWGIFFKQPSLSGLVLPASTSLFLYLTARIEEKENIQTFGSLYSDYMQKSKMFIPYLF